MNLCCVNDKLFYINQNNLSNFYITGDSHTTDFMDLTLTTLNKSRGTTIYNICEDDTLDFKSQGVEDNSIVFISYGEIDIRYRILQHHLNQYKNINYLELKKFVENLIDKFINKLYTLNTNYNNINYLIYMPPLANDELYKNNMRPSSVIENELVYHQYGNIKDKMFIRNIMLNKLFEYEKLYKNLKIFIVDDSFNNINGFLDINLMDKTTIHIHNDYKYLLLNLLKKFIYKHFNVLIPIPVNIKIQEYFNIKLIKN